MIKQTIKSKLNAALMEWSEKKGVSPMPQYSLEEPPKNVGGDLASNVAMLCAKVLKTNPRKIAEELAAFLPEKLKGRVSKVDIAGAGFLNFTISDDFLFGELSKIMEEKEEFRHGGCYKKRKNAV